MKISKAKELVKDLILAFLAVAIVYIGFYLFGYQETFGWHYGMRNAVTGVVMLFLAQAVTGKDLLSPIWRPMGPVFIIGLLIYGGLIAKSRGTWGVNIETMNGYFLSFLSVYVLCAILEYFGSAYKKVRILTTLCTFLLVAYLSFCLFVYVSYYGIFGMVFTPPDMISVLITNPEEAKEFLDSHMGFAAFTGVVIALLVYLYACFRVIRKGYEEITLPHGKMRYALHAGQVLLMIVAIITAAHWMPRIFPAWDYHVAHKYLNNAAKAEKMHDKNLAKLQVTPGEPLDPDKPGTVIVVIGESANRDHHKAFNSKYPAETTPWLSKEKDTGDFYLFDKAYSNYPMTAQALSMFLTGVNQYNHQKPEDTITMVDIANKLGYDTYWISNQTPSSGNVALALSARLTKADKWTKPTGGDDMKVLPYIEEIPKDKNNFIIVHLEGSHDRYRDRVPAGFEGVNVAGHSETENEYDTSVMYTDHVLSEIFNYAKDNLNLKAMVYCSDHGEDMKYFHGSSQFTWDMVRIPFWIYLSPSYAKDNPEIAKELKNHEHSIFTNDLMFDTVCGLLKAPNNFYGSEYDLTSSSYSLTADKALTRHGERRIEEDPEMK